MSIAVRVNQILWKKKAALLLIPLLFFCPVLIWAQNTMTVKGRVLNELNAPIAGASVTSKETNTGVTTDENGNFSISVPSRSTLIISFVGYAPKEIKVNSPTVSISLQPGKNDLDQVVVIGYGTQRRKDVTGSVATISGEKVNEVPAVDISRALQGRIAGVQMSQTSSKPGSGMQIRIRGTRSLNATNDPLVVLDGIPFIGTLNDISPAEIKSIDILKDASATAIYGSRGANGVILVTTNKGSAGQKAHISYNGYAGFKKVWGEYPMMNGPEYAALRKANNATPGASIRTNTLDENDSVNTDWQKLLYQTGYVTNQDLSVTGGSEKGNYSVGFTYFKDQAVIPLQYYERYSIRTALEQKIGSLFRIGLVTNNYYTVNHDQNIGPYAALNLTPLINPRNPDGSWKPTVNINTGGPQWAYTAHALNALGDKYIDLTRAYTTNNSLFGEIRIPGVEGLKYRANLGLYFHQDDYGTYTGTGVFSGVATTASSASISNTKQVDYALENLLTYDRTFGGKHAISAVALYSVEQNTKWSSAASANHLPSDAFQFYNLSYVLADQNGTSTVGGGSYAQYGLLSYMGRIIYTYGDRYILSAAFRSDASSVLAPGHQWHSYPAISVGWNMKNENFMDKVSLVDALKLRVGYGETSNQAINPYQTLGGLTTSPYNFGPSGYAMGYYVTQLPNPALGWEFSKTWNYGVDFSILKNRLSGTIDYYTVNTSNVLLSVGLPTTSGVTSYTANIGATQNKGIELSLNGTVLDNLHGWTWEVGVNVYRNRNKLVSLYSGQPYDKGNLWFPGHPIDVAYDYKKIGLMSYADSTSGYMQAAYPGGNVGMIKVAYNSKDTSLHYVNGVPNRKNQAGTALNNDDRQIYDLQPEFEGGFNTRVAYKGLDLGITGIFKSGGTLISTLYSSVGYLNNLNTRSGNNVKVDYWTPTNNHASDFNTFAPRPGGVGGDNPAYGSTMGYFSASYLKIRTITMGYNFSQKWMKAASITRMRVYCTVENPFVFFSPYEKRSHMDPETNSYGDQNSAVQAGPHRILTIGTNTPSTRNFLIGLNVTF
ncbi:TonB-dependent receptor [Flavitalea sp. BT771]|uniref:SusC/RagA family TonB-linked outer membrane protein n=1 Tax=Flavitalea sp. BT771 TaxID=3063329 RepID=UPI0026E3D553|nr:TonB-dependent receptor [Flavitalea sp. BT771]MDO6434783.1 TonB-dependent receptor [Flavitalea sp. BT771]MDV6223683.1 TonB-dependent receptor [Flavitalea sp. BT771]